MWAECKFSPRLLYLLFAHKYASIIIRFLRFLLTVWVVCWVWWARTSLSSWSYKETTVWPRSTMTGPSIGPLLRRFVRLALETYSQKRRETLCWSWNYHYCPFHRKTWSSKRLCHTTMSSPTSLKRMPFAFTYIEIVSNSISGLIYT